MVRILTSGFTNGFPNNFSQILKKYIKPKMNFTFIASEFEGIHLRNDWYCGNIIKMFSYSDISFTNINIIDSRIKILEAYDIVKNSDVIWLAGGDTPIQFTYLKTYNLIPCLRENNGIIIGMSAGSINMSKIALCTLTCEHSKQEIYESLGLVDFSVEPHFSLNNFTEELITLSKKYHFYGIPDDSAIIVTNDNIVFINDVFIIQNGICTKAKN